MLNIKRLILSFVICSHVSSFCTTYTQEWKTYLQDILLFNKILFSTRTLEIIQPIVPLYLLSRMSDSNICKPFYCAHCHKNLHQLPHFCHTFGEYGITIFFSVIIYNAIFSSDPDLKRTSLTAIYIFPFIFLYKNFFKKILFCDAALRPRNQFFCKEKRFHGGFPSGHMAEIAFLATLFGIRYGAKWALPLSVYGVFVMYDFINGNRHYLSQLIAGIGLGVVFGFAANDVINERLSKNLCLDFSTNSLKLSYHF